MNRQRFPWWMTAGLLAVGLLLASGTLQAQANPSQQGRVEVGVRVLAGDRSSSKFDEYRDIPSGFFIQRFEINLDQLFGNRYHFAAQTRETLEKDQSYLLGFGRYGKYRFQFRWYQTPHRFTNGARTLFEETSPGVFTLPLPIRTALQAKPQDATLYLAGRPVLGVGLRRDSGAGTFLYTPTANWAVVVEYAQEKQFGTRPFGTTTNAFSNMIELPEPIDYRTHFVKAGAEYGNRKWGFQVGYSGSIFQNNVSELVWDNPFRVADAVGNAAHGRLDLYPDNAAHSLSFAGALNLGNSTRVMMSFVPGWMRQNDPFLPFTINSALSTLPALPGTSLNGAKQTLAMNYTVTSRASRSLEFTARYRSYDYNNDSSSFVFSDYVRTDAGLVGMARRNLPYAYNRKNVEVETLWEFVEGNFFKLSYEWERFDRQHRDVEISGEHTVGAAFDLNPNKRILLRTSYKHGERRPRHYEPNEETFPLGEGPFALGQIEELRKFDEGARGRDRGDTLLQITPIDAVTFSASFGINHDLYRDTLYGLMKDFSHNYSFELTYSPRTEISFFGEYTRERYLYRQRSRQRVPPTPTAPANDSANNDWESHLRDLVDTWSAGIFGSLFDNRLSFDAFYSLSAAEGTIRTLALGSPTVPGFLVTTARDYPDTRNRFHQVVGTIKYRIKENFYPKFEYRYERYDRLDFQTDPIAPYMVPVDSSTGTSLFLGAVVPGYKAHILAFALEYRF